MKTAVQISVSIPLELRQKLDELKREGRAFNISEVCASAIEKKVFMIETISEARNGLIARLRAEKMENDGGIRESAMKMALKDVELEDFGLNFFREFSDLQDQMERSPEIAGFTVNELLNGLSDDLQEWMNSTMEDFDDLNDEERLAFFDGYMKGVLEVWSEIKEEV